MFKVGGPFCVQVNCPGNERLDALVASAHMQPR